MKLNCSICGKSFDLPNSHIARGDGKFCSRQCMGIGRQGAANPNWKGDAVQYLQIHRWIENRIPKPAVCPHCGKVGLMDLHARNGNYSRILEDWEWLCRSCHMNIDGRNNRRNKLGKFIKKENVEN